MAKVFDPKKVSAIINGKYAYGFMDGTFIKASKNEDNVKVHVGADGEVTYTESADNTGTIVITFKQNSTFLPYLQSLAASKKLFPAYIVDASGTTKFQAGGSQCRVIKIPDREFGTEVAGVEVSIHVSNYSAK